MDGRMPSIASCDGTAVIVHVKFTLEGGEEGEKENRASLHQGPRKLDIDTLLLLSIYLEIPIFMCLYLHRPCPSLWRYTESNELVTVCCTSNNLNRCIVNVVFHC